MPTTTSISGGDPIESINGLLGGCRTLLDVGAGIGLSVAAMRVPIRIGLECFNERRFHLTFVLRQIRHPTDLGRRRNGHPRNTNPS